MEIALSTLGVCHITGAQIDFHATNSFLFSLHFDKIDPRSMIN